MQQNNTQVWRSMLQLAQATYAVLEREVPEAEGLPASGFPVLRLLRWHGEKTLPAIAAFVGVPLTTMEETIGEMERLGLVRNGAALTGSGSAVFELAPGGVAVARRIVDAQRERVERTVACLPDDQQEMAAKLLESLATELVKDAAGFGITCSECWAMDARECTKPGTAECCSFLKSQWADLDPDLGEGPEDCPSACSTSTTQFVTLGISSEAGS